MWFSAAAASLYAGRVITVGTLLAVFLSTSDEMLPIFISEAVAPATIFKILGAKVCIAIISGFLAELVYVNVFKKKEKIWTSMWYARKNTAVARMVS